MIKVLQMCESLGMGGTQKVLQILSKYLDKNEFDVHVAGFDSGGERVQIIQNLGIQVSVFDGNYDKFKDFLLKNNFDIIHFHRSKMYSIDLFKKIKSDFPNIKIVEMSVFGNVTSLDEDKYVDYRVFISRFCALRFVRRYGLTYEEFAKKNGVLYYVLDFDEWQKLDKKEISEYKKSLGVKEDEILIGRLGRKDAYKFGDLCIDMMPYLVKKLPNIKYLVMGLPDEKLEKIKKLGLEKYFIITQPSTDLKKLNLFYQSIDLLVHTSFIGESFGNVYTEAMANGKAIITNSTPYKDNAQVEIVQNGINGLIGVYPEDFADKVYNLLTNKNKLNLFEKNNLEYAKTFDAKIWIKYYQKLYNDLVNGKTEEYFFKVTDLQDFEKEYDNTINALHSKKNWLYEGKIFWYRLQTKLKTMLGK